jgi:hypothetical protein
MRWREIVESASTGATSSGSVAVVQQPMGMVSRNGANLMSGKYTTDPTPNTPKELKRFKNNARGQFKNSISN